MIRPAKIVEIAHILRLTRACTEHMTSQGIYQWNELYPSHQAFLEDVKREELYVLVAETEIIGCITISTKMDSEYAPVNWLTPNKNNLYIHRLAVHPDQQGKGYARALMDMAESNARSGNFNSIRLDTFSKNKRNQRFYEARGYTKLESIYFQKQSEYPFFCYELVL
jgi:ribosomal protein S18 acetylase RimI-like enzyme